MNRRTVLVVDDERDIRETLRDALEDEGYSVELAENGQEALDKLRALPKPRAMILDIIMPVMSGTELYGILQEDPELAKIPLIVSTSDPSRAPSGVLLMKKPIDLDRLLSAVANLF